MGTIKYLWGHRYGRIALLVVMIGVIGLVTHYWTAMPLMLTLPRRV